VGRRRQSAIAIAHAFGVFVKPEDILSIGIDKISNLDLKYARENNYTIKLIARAIKLEGKIYGLVAPQFIENSNPISDIRNENNAVQVQGAFSDKQLFVGKGAGSYPTGSAVLSDISALSYNYRYEYKKIHQSPLNCFSNDWCIDAFVRFQKSEAVSIQDFQNFKSGYAANDQHYRTGEVSFNKLKEWTDRENISIILAPQATFIGEPKSLSVEYSAA
jgi:homoserine dehydrogenase